MKKGLFITLEGGEGSGKSTAIHCISEKLRKMGFDVLVTREPGGVECAEAIRNVIMDYQMDALTECYLYASARREHLVNKVVPALENGTIVLCDRFVDSSMVYQGLARGLGMDLVKKINEPIINGYMPDITLWLDVDVEEGLNRIKKNEEREVNRFDEEDLSFHYTVKEGYQAIYNDNKERIKKVDANKDLESVSEQSFNFIMEKLT